MGNFDQFTYSGGQWLEGPAPEPYLQIDIHDSDLATVDFAPAPASAGRFYMGFEPRYYFEDETVSAPIDRDAVVAAFVVWAESNLGLTVAPETVAGFFADPEGEEPEDDFVEDSVAALIEALGLPMPDELNED